ncbi:hypothetical protein Tsp_09952 [Trichinella spiralis]|uniref:hypothetical protein n=1 Tax=Trichinella spiralis TaxID=6334 RepID=UPI0001EFE01A|nr:hypothetical protein Tsp_09952 [Trichinella spiralis]
MVLPASGSASGRPLSFIKMLSGFPGVLLLHPVRVYRQCATLPLMVSYTVRLRPNYFHYPVGSLPTTVELSSSWHGQTHAVVWAEEQFLKPSSVQSGNGPESARARPESHLIRA